MANVIAWAGMFIWFQYAFIIQAAEIKVVRSSNTISGRIKDPAYQKGFMALSGEHVTKMRQGSAGKVNLIMTPRALGESGKRSGYALLIELTEVEGEVKATAIFQQWADYDAYDGKLTRKVAARNGKVVISSFSSKPRMSQPICGRFVLCFDIGRVEGSFFVDTPHEEKSPSKM